MTNNYQEEADPNEVLEALEDFPYLNELVKSLLYRLKLSSAMVLEKGLKVDNQKRMIEELESRAI
jgi:hypothetical protein